MAEAAAAGVGVSVAGIAGAVGGILSNLSSFASTVITLVIDSVRRIAQWYMNLLAKDPGSAIALALVAVYWLMPGV